MSDLVRPVVEGRVVPDDALHPLTIAGMCLRCGRGEMSPGCESRDLGPRVRALRERGLCERVADLLHHASPADLRRVEGLAPDEIEQLNAAATRNAGDNDEHGLP